MMQVGLRGVKEKEEAIRRIKEAVQSKSWALLFLITTLRFGWGFEVKKIITKCYIDTKRKKVTNDDTCNWIFDVSSILSLTPLLL
jgi:hypothetical protein